MSYDNSCKLSLLLLLAELASVPINDKCLIFFLVVLASVCFENCLFLVLCYSFSILPEYHLLPVNMYTVCTNK